MSTKKQTSNYSDYRKRPCCICRRWFRPNPRVGKRQKACSNPECQRLRRKKNQKSWRDRNPDYGLAWRIDKKANDEQKAREPPAATAPLDRLPWDLAKDEFGVQGAEFIGSFGRLLRQDVKDQMGRYFLENKGELHRLVERDAKDQLRVDPQ